MANAGTTSHIFDICSEMMTIPDSREFRRNLLPSLLEKGIRWIKFCSADDANNLHIIMNSFTGLEGMKVCAVPNLPGCKFVEFARTKEYEEKMKVFLCFEQEVRHFRLFSLKHLILDGVRNSKKEVNNIVSHTPNVEVLCVRLVETGLNDVDITKIIASLKNLKCLTLKHCRPVGFHNGNASDYHSDSLECLSLIKCRNVDNISVRTISHAFPNLRQIEVTRCIGISDECFRYLDQMKNLKSVSMNTCLNITKTGRETFLKTANAVVITDKQLTLDDST